MEIKIDSEFKGFDIPNPSEMKCDSVGYEAKYSHVDKEIINSFNDPYILFLLKNRDTRLINENGESETRYEMVLDELLSRERLDFMFDKMFEKIEEQASKEAK